LDEEVKVDVVQVGHIHSKIHGHGLLIKAPKRR
jgi:hypothetical protein